MAPSRARLPTRKMSFAEPFLVHSRYFPVCSSVGFSGHYPAEPCAVPFSESTLVSLSSPGGQERQFADFLLSVIVSGAVGVRRSDCVLSRIWPGSSQLLFRPWPCFQAACFTGTWNVSRDYRALSASVLLASRRVQVWTYGLRQ